MRRIFYKKLVAHFYRIETGECTGTMTHVLRKPVELKGLTRNEMVVEICRRHHLDVADKELVTFHLEYFDDPNEWEGFDQIRGQDLADGIDEENSHVTYPEQLNFFIGKIKVESREH